jgi:signal transduction histidine kinase
MGLTKREHTPGTYRDILFHTMDCIVLHLDPSGCIVSINPFASRFFNIDPEKITGKPFWGKLAPHINSQGKNQVELFQAFLDDTERETAFVCEVQTADGEVAEMTFAVTVFKDEAGCVCEIAVIGIDRAACERREEEFRQRIETFEKFIGPLKLFGDDISDDSTASYYCEKRKKRSKNAILEKEKEFRFCLDNAQVLLTVTDENGVIRRINKAGAKMFGRTTEKMVGRVFTDFLPDFERERVLRTFRRDFKKAVNRGGSHTVGMGGNTNKINALNGLRDIQFCKTGIKVFKDGKFEGILNTAVDITDIVNTRNELKRHHDQLEHLVAERSAELQSLKEEKISRERLNALGKMADVVSQEIRTPLSTISNSFFVIKERLKDKDIGVKKSLERADRAIRRCYSIVYEFKEFTQNDGLRKAPVCIDGWMDSLIDELEEIEGISLVRRFESGVTTDIDQDRLKRAVLCMIDNGRQALSTADGGCLTIRSKKSFNRLEIEIEDDGPGIPSDTLEKIFEPLFSTRSFGLGLGMTICRQILQAHGGGVSIESNMNKGTKVVLWVPIEKKIPIVS